jgi:hypothetical protein
MSVDINKAVGCLVGLAAGDRNGGSLRMSLSLTDGIIENKGEFNINELAYEYSGGKKLSWCK